MPLNYKKDGSLDMRYSSSRAATSSGSYGGGGYSASGRSGSAYGGGGASSSSSGFHHKKDGSLDMRYSSSKQATPSSTGTSGSFGRDSPSTASSSSHLNYKKDGSLDMRYASSKQAMGSFSGSIPAEIHVKKDGTPDMRFSSSKNLMSQFGNLTVNNKPRQLSRGLPSNLPLTKNGFPDMRTRDAKIWVQQQAAYYAAAGRNDIPAWLPTKKDGTLDSAKKVVQEFYNGNVSFARGGSAATNFNHDTREEYYRKKFSDCAEFRYHVEHTRSANVIKPQAYILPDSAEIREQFKSTQFSRDLASMVQHEIPNTIPEINYDVLKASFPDEYKATIGTGSFGVVFKAKLSGETVAVKRLHLFQMNTREKKAFVTEMKILALIGKHPNLVKLYGFTLNPPAFVMEYVKLGSLSYLLHYCENNEMEAKITDGRIKHGLLIGIAAGMKQIHSVGVIHGDLKTANILVTENYHAKITDFGLASFRGKTSSSVVSCFTVDDGENVIGGTGAYMDPGLLNSSYAPSSSSDVYSFGILLNEVIQEEEPYSGEETNFYGRGAFGAANYAGLGNRPYIKPKTPDAVQRLIKDCWNSNPNQRPTFEAILVRLNEIVIPNSFRI